MKPPVSAPAGSSQAEQLRVLHLVRQSWVLGRVPGPSGIASTAAGQRACRDTRNSSVIIKNKGIAPCFCKAENICPGHGRLNGGRLHCELSPVSGDGEWRCDQIYILKTSVDHSGRIPGSSHPIHSFHLSPNGLHVLFQEDELSLPLEEPFANLPVTSPQFSSVVCRSQHCSRERLHCPLLHEQIPHVVNF